jgi:hypothetical protein
MPKPSKSLGMVSKPNSNGPPVPKTDQINDSDKDEVLSFTGADLFQNLTDDKDN